MLWVAPMALTRWWMRGSGAALCQERGTAFAWPLVVSLGIKMQEASKHVSWAWCLHVLQSKGHQEHAAEKNPQKAVSVISVKTSFAKVGAVFITSCDSWPVKPASAACTGLSPQALHPGHAHARQGRRPAEGCAWPGASTDLQVLCRLLPACRLWLVRTTGQPPLTTTCAHSGSQRPECCIALQAKAPRRAQCSWYRLHEPLHIASLRHGSALQGLQVQANRQA